MRHPIFVPLAANPEELRETDATPCGEGTFKIVGVSPGEPLRYKRGEIVECDIHTLPNGKKGLVAIRSVSADPEVKTRRIIFGVLGLIVGAIFGAIFAISVELSLRSIEIGAAIGAPVFAFCSVTWGDDAWVFLSRLIRLK